MRFNSRKVRTSRQTHAASSAPKIGRLTYMSHQPPNPSPPASPVPAQAASWLASGPTATGCRIVQATTSTAISTQGRRPVAQAGDASDHAHERSPLGGRHHSRAQEVRDERRAHPVGHGFAQDERRNRQQEADVDSEVHEQRLVDSAGQHPARVEGPRHQGQPRDEGKEHGPAADAESPRGHEAHVSLQPERHVVDEGQFE